jgi:hypothetical protein
MDTRAATLILVALSSAVCAAVGFALTAWVEVFAPCRVAYRQPPAVYESLACQIHAAITLFSLLLVAAAAVCCVAAGIRLRGSRNTQRS